MIHSHPKLPFIECGKPGDFLRRSNRGGVAPSDDPSELYTIHIDGEDLGGLFATVEDAFDSAEAALFDPDAHGDPFGPQYVDNKINTLVGNGHPYEALALAELKGRWEGRREAFDGVLERARNVEALIRNIVPYPVRQYRRPVSAA